MKRHNLKIHQQPYADITSGAKTSVLSYDFNPRFEVGDLLILEEMLSSGEVTGNKQCKIVTHIEHNLPDFIVVVSFRDESEAPARRIVESRDEPGYFMPAAEQQALGRALRKCVTMVDDVNAQRYLKLRRDTAQSKRLAVVMCDEGAAPTDNFLFGTDLDAAVDAMPDLEDV